MFGDDPSFATRDLLPFVIIHARMHGGFSEPQLPIAHTQAQTSRAHAIALMLCAGQRYSLNNPVCETSLINIGFYTHPGSALSNQPLFRLAAPRHEGRIPLGRIMAMPPASVKTTDTRVCEFEGT